MTPPIPLACAALALAFATPAVAQDTRPAVAGRLAAPAAAGFLGTNDAFGARVDADGDLLVITDPVDLTASVVDMVGAAYEEFDLLTVSGQPVANITHVFDAAIEGDRACVLVGVSGSAYHLLEFERVDVSGTIGWVFDSSVNVTAAVVAPSNLSAGFVDLVDGDAVVTIDAGSADFFARFTTSALTFVPHPSALLNQAISAGSFTSVAMATGSVV